MASKVKELNGKISLEDAKSELISQITSWARMHDVPPYRRDALITAVRAEFDKLSQTSMPRGAVGAPIPRASASGEGSAGAGSKVGLSYLIAHWGLRFSPPDDQELCKIDAAIIYFLNHIDNDWDYFLTKLLFKVLFKGYRGALGASIRAIPAQSASRTKD